MTSIKSIIIENIVENLAKGDNFSRDEFIEKLVKLNWVESIKGKLYSKKIEYDDQTSYISIPINTSEPFKITKKDGKKSNIRFNGKSSSDFAITLDKKAGFSGEEVDVKHVNSLKEFEEIIKSYDSAEVAYKNMYRYNIPQNIQDEIVKKYKTVGDTPKKLIIKIFNS